MSFRYFVYLICVFILTITSCYKGNDYNYTYYYYASWSCQNNASCISGLGYNQGAAGGFCSYTSCQNWAASNVSIYGTSTYTCSISATYTIYVVPKEGIPCL